MKRSTLLLIASKINDVSDANDKLLSMLDMMNLTTDERNRIEDAIYMAIEHVNRIRMSDIKDLNKYVDVDSIEGGR